MSDKDAIISAFGITGYDPPPPSTSTFTSVVSLEGGVYDTCQLIPIEDQVWQNWLQDMGCELKELIVTTYCQNEIPPYGPLDVLLYYPHFSVIDIDYIKSINKLKGDGMEFVS